MSLRENVVWFFTFFLLLHLPHKLTSENPCIYKLNGKGVIDLTSVGRIDGTPGWKRITPEKTDGHVYSYNPCHSFTETACIDVAGCQVYATDEKVAYSLGPQSSVQWKTTSGQDIPTLVYISDEKRSLSVDLRCLNSGESDKLEVHGHDLVTGLYTMTLSSKCACWDGCKDSSKPKGLSGGSLVIILFMVLVVIYLVAFMSYNKFRRQATGINIFPHRTFWTSLLGYSVDGVIFVFRKVTCKSIGYNTVP
ncbi:unnamed protein product [Adineta steineri]|uniref:Uncharacterized protein n=1 Tax=Adineta steineri TaxID=433720 RepID=A0A819CDA4_9BILA|nr:unnamed protein product [Adineta steineri]